MAAIDQLSATVKYAGTYMNPGNLQDFLATAQNVVRYAGDTAKQMRSSMKIQAYKEGGDMVTNADLAAEKHVLSTLQEQYPHHGFLSEERGEVNTDAEHVWILDPIDGTKYYARGVPLYSVSLALQAQSELVLGVVYCPEFNRMYAAASGIGSSLNGIPIRCTKINNLPQATICLEIPSCTSPQHELNRAIERMTLLIKHAFRVRILGVGAIGLSFFANDGFDVYLNLNNNRKIWDYAAGWVIAREAGATVKEVGSALMAGPLAVCNEIQSLLNLDDETRTQ